MLGGDERSAGRNQRLLGIEHVERRALADPSLLAHAIKRDFGRSYLRGGGVDLRLGGVELTPTLGDVLLHRGARRVEVEPPLTERLLALAARRKFGATLVDRHRNHANNRSRQSLQRRESAR